MKVHRSYLRLPSSSKGCVVAIGNFDGVHRGHKALIKAAQQKADDLGRKLGIVTFEPHPLQILRPDIAPKRLTPFRTKTKILAENGVERVFALKFDRNMREKSPKAFVQDVLVDGLAASHVVVGYDFRFGHKASGDVETLITEGKAHSFGVSKIDPKAWQGDICSSSRIRTLIDQGNVEAAADLLDHPFVVEGRVVSGDRRGRELGYPTANIRRPDPSSINSPALWPKSGIYAVRAAWQEAGQTIWADGAANIGLRPTFDDQQGHLLEIHLLDRNVDLYGKRLCCQFIRHLRDEQAFADIELLKEQMAKDCEDAKAILANSPAHHQL